MRHNAPSDDCSVTAPPLAFVAVLVSTGVTLEVPTAQTEARAAGWAGDLPLGPAGPIKELAAPCSGALELAATVPETSQPQPRIPTGGTALQGLVGMPRTSRHL